MNSGFIMYVNPGDLSKWDRRFIELASNVGQWSKGPRKFVGAALVRPDRSIASLGYNGPPRGFDDAAFLAMPRDEQHKIAVHAEVNAFRQMHNNERYGPKEGYTLYVSPLLPCAVCARMIVSYGVQRVVAYCGHISPDWRASADEAERIFINNGVSCTFAID